MSLQLNSGAYYLTRGGLTAFCVGLDPFEKDGNWVVCIQTPSVTGHVGTYETFHYFDDGFLNDDGEESEWDLVQEICLLQPSVGATAIVLSEPDNGIANIGPADVRQESHADFYKRMQRKT